MLFSMNISRMFAAVLALALTCLSTGRVAEAAPPQPTSPGSAASGAHGDLPKPPLSVPKPAAPKPPPSAKTPPAKPAPSVSPLPVAAPQVDPLVDPFRKRYNGLVAGDYGAIKASTNLLYGLVGTYDEWKTVDRILLAGMPNKQHWKPAPYMLAVINDLERSMCQDIYGYSGYLEGVTQEEREKKREVCQSRWEGHHKVTGALLAYVYVKENAAHFTSNDGVIALNIAHKALATVHELSGAADLGAWIQAKLNDQGKADAKALFTAEYVAPDYRSAAIDACRYDLDAASLEKALNGLAAAGKSSDEDPRWTKWKVDALAARKAGKSCWDIGWRYLSAETECKDNRVRIYYTDEDACQLTGPVVLEFPNDRTKARQLDIY